MVAFDEPELLYLARRRARQRFGLRKEFARDLKAGDPRAAELTDPLEVDRRRVVDDDHRRDTLAPGVVWEPDDG